MGGQYYNYIFKKIVINTRDLVNSTPDKECGIEPPDSISHGVSSY